jgi:hypothetical protein
MEPDYGGKNHSPRAYSVHYIMSLLGKLVKD